MTKKNKMFRFDPELIFNSKQVAEHLNRNFNNLVEHLLIQEFNRLEKAGVEFDKYVPEGGEFVGTGADKNLQKQFDAHNEG